MPDRDGVQRVGVLTLHPGLLLVFSRSKSGRSKNNQATCILHEIVLRSRSEVSKSLHKRCKMLRAILASGLMILAALIGSPLTAGKGKAPEIPPLKGTSETIKLFNGKNLDGWEGYQDLWSVKDGVIVAKNTKPIKYSTYLLTKRKFSDFRLIFAAKLVESEMHSGVAIWGRIAPQLDGKVKLNPKEARTEYTYQGHLVMFPSGWGLYDLYRRHGGINTVDTKPAKAAGKQHDWNDMEILAQGNRIRLVVNGKEVLDWRDPEPKYVAEGPIGLQLHENKVPQEIHFKGLVLTTFPEDKLTTVK